MSATYEYLYSFEDDPRSATERETKRKALLARLNEELKKQHAAFAHCHEILVAADVHAEAQPVSVTLYDWTSLQQQPTSPTTEATEATSAPSPPSTIELTTSPSETFSVREPASALAHVKGHFDLGVIRLPDTTTSIADLLVDEARDTEYDFCGEIDTETGGSASTDGLASTGNTPPSLPELVCRLRERLASQTSPVGRGQPVQLWSFPVQSKVPDNVFGNSTKFYLWQWYKPSSPYRKVGTWEMSLDDVLENGSWQAGKELTLVLRRVSAEVWQKFLDNGVPLNDTADDNED